MSPRLRLVVLVALGAYIAFGPFFPQVLDVGRTVFRRWTMFTFYGADICDVRYFKIGQGGRREVLDRHALLGAKHRGVRKLRDAKAVRVTGRDLCRALGRGADVRVVARCGTPDGWRPAFDGREELCVETERPSRGRTPSGGVGQPRRGRRGT